MTKEEIQHWVDRWVDRHQQTDSYLLSDASAIVQCNLLLLLLDKVERIANDVQKIALEVPPIVDNIEEQEAQPHV